MSRRDRYRCTVERDSDGTVECIVLDAIEADGAERRRRLDGERLSIAVDPVRRIVQAGGIPGAEMAGSATFDLDLRTGVHLDLLLSAVASLRRVDRITTIGDRIAEMGHEEAAYWHAKVGRRGGLPALRRLLREGIA